MVPGLPQEPRRGGPQIWNRSHQDRRAMDSMAVVTVLRQVPRRGEPQSGTVFFLLFWRMVTGLLQALRHRLHDDFCSDRGARLPLLQQTRLL